MNINEISTAAVDRLDPSLKRMIDSYESATHPEIINGRKVMIEKRERMIEIVSLAITDAVAAVRMGAEMQAQKAALEKLALETALAAREEELRDLLLEDRSGEILSQNAEAIRSADEPTPTKPEISC